MVLVEEEWTEFNNILKSYAPLDWDEYNCHMVFDIEHGKKINFRLQRKLKKEIYDAINELPDKCKEVFKLSYLHDMKTKR